jgi:acyl dehydratase
MKVSTLTGKHNYFEDFNVGDKLSHRRGRTVDGSENTYFTLTTLNTASPHFNKHEMETYMGGKFPERLVNGGFTICVVVGLTTQDIAENAIDDLSYTNIRMLASVHPGDTLYAHSEILEVREFEDRADAGMLRYRFEGTNQRGEPVVRGERTILLKKRAYDSV